MSILFAAKAIFVLQTKVAEAIVTALETNSANTRLFSADSVGFVCIWNIEGYCVFSSEVRSPQRELMIV